MRRPVVAGALLALVGLVWIGQGLGILRGSSFMVDDIRWAIAGVVMVVAGATLVILGRASHS
jgi:hypothetical protein